MALLGDGFPRLVAHSLVELFNLRPSKMEDNNGWITLHRKLLKNPICKKPDYLSVWIHLLLMANHEETSFIWNNEKHILKAGQLLTGRKKLSKITKVKETQVYKILNYLELEQQIRQEKTTKYTVITIINWHRYQDRKEKKNNNATTTRQQRDTYNNVNNDNNIYISKKERDWREQEYQKTMDLISKKKRA